jgi:hypothetical protein
MGRVDSRVGSGRVMFILNFFCDRVTCMYYCDLSDKKCDILLHTDLYEMLFMISLCLLTYIVFFLLGLSIV